jgi:hypothetical protein
LGKELSATCRYEQSSDLFESVTGDPRERVGEPSLRADTIEPRGRDQPRRDGGAVGAAFRHAAAFALRPWGRHKTLRRRPRPILP